MIMKDAVSYTCILQQHVLLVAREAPIIHASYTPYYCTGTVTVLYQCCNSRTWKKLQKRRQAQTQSYPNHNCNMYIA
jgi:hypothetical protein